MSRFGATVRSLRFRRGLSQEELAGRADLHRTYIAGVEGGARNVTLKSIEKLALALEVSIADLLQSDPLDAPAGVVEILLVEDSADDVALTLDAFREARIANPVHVVSDGLSALDFLFGAGVYAARAKEPLPRLILLDLELPKMNGVEVLARIRRDPRTRHIPVVVLTGSRNSRDVAECKKLGAVDYIVKPVDFFNFSQVTPGLLLDWALVDRKVPAGS
jgi:CheY-like chemotaxis protein/DNA-binding Xre family transcriptional regulator